MNRPAVIALLAFAGAVWSAGAGAAGFPTTVHHALGDTIIPAEPKRVVSVGYNDQDFLYALGVAPVGVHEWYGGLPYASFPWDDPARAALGATPAVLASPELNIEWVAAQQPDLIVATYYDLDGDSYKALSRIAPVVARPDGYDAWGAPWQVQLRLLDEATHGTEVDADRIIADLTAQVAAQRAKYPELAGKVGIMADYRDGDLVVWSKTFPPQRFLADLGMTFPTALEGKADGTDEIHLSLEQFRLIDVDAVVWPNSAEADIMGLPLYSDLRLATEGRSLFPESIDPVLAAALWWQTPLSLAYAVDRFPALLAATADGNPSTH